ncbi:Retrovirus-related Pol polyprotein from type-1 retrotransposable element [Trichinella nativa]|uniref:Retrovirus-related Pol polyprotein from type-1 retrotransposable element n=1 Tax=Trichinella nativa TaxID=6335 RepID=A0A0V1KJE4_9BILA|nr:Retrovirus-related Pol polyprotein from type-1 retrotransposable element [Trichinella nativa]
MPPLKPEQKVVLIRSHLIPRLQFQFLTAEADSRKASLADSIIRGATKEMLHSAKAGICTDFFYIPLRDGGLGLNSLVEHVLFSRQMALFRMARSNDPITKSIALFFIQRGGSTPDLKVSGAAQLVFRQNCLERFSRTYQGTGWKEFQGNPIGNSWQTNGRDLGRNFIMAVKFRSITAATRAENNRGCHGTLQCRTCANTKGH